MGTALVTTISSRSGEHGRHPGGGGSGVEQHGGTGERKELGRRPRDRLLVISPGDLAGVHIGFHHVQRPHRYRTAVDPAQQSGAVENGEVPAHVSVVTS